MSQPETKSCLLAEFLLLGDQLFSEGPLLTECGPSTLWICFIQSPLI